MPDGKIEGVEADVAGGTAVVGEVSPAADEEGFVVFVFAVAGGAGAGDEGDAGASVETAGVGDADIVAGVDLRGEVKFAGDVADYLPVGGADDAGESEEDGGGGLSRESGELEGVGNSGVDGGLHALVSGVLEIGRGGLSDGEEASGGVA